MAFFFTGIVVVIGWTANGVIISSCHMELLELLELLGPLELLELMELLGLVELLLLLLLLDQRDRWSDSGMYFKGLRFEGKSYVRSVVEAFQKNMCLYRTRKTHDSQQRKFRPISDDKWSQFYRGIRRMTKQRRSFCSCFVILWDKKKGTDLHMTRTAQKVLHNNLPVSIDIPSRSIHS